MTESDWLASDNAAELIRWLLTVREGCWIGQEVPDGFALPLRGRWGARKLRLYAVAVSRACCYDPPQPPPMPSGCLELAQDWAEAAADSTSESTPGWVRGLWVSAIDPASAARQAADYKPRHPLAVHFVREVFGNPFCPVAVDPAWLAWQGGTIPRLAQAIYDDRAFDRLPILADALEEAGCTEEEVLRHCRGQERCPYCLEHPGQSWGFVNSHRALLWCGQCNGGSLRNGSGWIRLRGPHVRGCWVVDLLTGRA